MTQPPLPDLDWSKGNGLLPAIVQNATTGQVLMLGYMNAAALEKSLTSGYVTFYSRSKQRLWIKGETSKNRLRLIRILPDCDADSLLILAHPQGPTCHKGTQSCFIGQPYDTLFLHKLESLIQARQTESETEDTTNSYTKQLFLAGHQRIAQKLGEEGVEVALAAAVGDKAALKEESADLLYHLLVLLADQGLNLTNVIQTLERRHHNQI